MKICCIGAGYVGGDDGGGSVDAPPAACTTPTNGISDNHGHVLAISLADVNAAAAKTYPIMGSADHAHSVTISATQFAQIKAGQPLLLTTTSGGGHTHAVTVMCAS